MVNCIDQARADKEADACAYRSENGAVRCGSKTRSTDIRCGKSADKSADNVTCGNRSRYLISFFDR